MICYRFNGKGLRVTEDSQWFAARDLCEILGMDWDRERLARTVQENRGLIQVNGRPVPVVSERGLRYLVEKSQDAEFGKWFEAILKGTTMNKENTMNTTVVPFNFNGSDIRVITDAQGEPWFVAKDVCKVLGTKTTDLAAILDADEKGTDTISTPGGPQKMSTINESGLYSLVLRSRKPEAKVFRKWVTSVVLPAIRKTGGYIQTTPEMSDLEILARGMLVAQKAIEERDRLLAEQRPKVEVYDQFMASTNTHTLEGLAKVLGMTGIKFTRMLRADGYLAKDRDKRGKFTNLPNRKYVDQGLFKVVPASFSYTDKEIGEDIRVSVFQTRVLPPALDYFRKVYRSETVH